MTSHTKANTCSDQSLNNKEAMTPSLRGIVRLRGTQSALKHSSKYDAPGQVTMSCTSRTN